MMAKEEQRVPNLRFKGFTDYWEQHKLGDIAKVTKLAGFEFTKYINYSSKGKILAIRGLNIKDGKFNLQDVKYIDNSDFNKLTRSKLRQDDILFTYVGTIGNSAIVPAGVKWYLAPNVCLIRTQTENAKFISHLIQSDKFQHQEIPKWITTSSQPALSMENIRKFSIILPTISEQLKISNLVSIIDTLITLQQRKLDLLKQFKKGFLQKMFADKDSKQPVLRFKGFHDDWERRKLGDISKTKRGLTYKPSNIDNTGIRVLRSSNIKEDTFVISADDVFVKESAVNIPFVENGDILITAANGSTNLVGKHAIIRDIPKNSAVHGGFMLITTSKEYEFLNALMSSNWYKKFIKKYVAGGNGAIGNLRKNDLDNQKIYVPKKDEQEKIGNFFKMLDSLITLHQRKQNHLKLLKKSLLQQMFM